MNSGLPSSCKNLAARRVPRRGAYLAFLAALGLALAQEASPIRTEQTRPASQGASRSAPSQFSASEGGAVDAAVLDHLKTALNKYLIALWQEESAASLVERLELAVQSQPATGRNGRPFESVFRQNAIKDRKSQLHLAVVQKERLQAQRANMAEAFVREAPRWSAALGRRRDSLRERIQDAATDAKARAQLRAEEAEARSFIRVFDELAQRPADAQEILQKALGKPLHSLPRPESPLQTAGSKGAKAARKARLPALIRRLELQQQDLMSRYRENEAELRRLRGLLESQAASRLASHPAQLPAAPPRQPAAPQTAQTP